MRSQVWAGREEVTKQEQSGGHGYLWHFKACLILYIPLLFDDGCCCACPTLWCGGSDNTQFMMGSSDHMGTWWPMVKYLVSVKAQQQPRAISQKESSYLDDGRALLQHPKDLCCESPVGDLPKAANSLCICHLRFRRPWVCWVIWPKSQGSLHSSLDLLQSPLLSGPHSKLAAF